MSAPPSKQQPRGSFGGDCGFDLIHPQSEATSRWLGRASAVARFCPHPNVIVKHPHGGVKWAPKISVAAEGSLRSYVKSSALPRPVDGPQLGLGRHGRARRAHRIRPLGLTVRTLLPLHRAPGGGVCCHFRNRPACGSSKLIHYIIGPSAAPVHPPFLS
jgi:hypothetical protein